MTICLRAAVMADAERILDWRNSPAVREVSLDPREIALNEHLEWFARSLEMVARYLLVAEEDGVPLGVLRFDLAGERAEVSIFLDPRVVGRGLGTTLLRDGAEWVRKNLPAVKKLQARIKHNNIASQRAFEKAGYNESWRLYEMNLDAQDE